MANLDLQTIQQIEYQLKSIELSYAESQRILTDIRKEFNNCLSVNHTGFLDIMKHYNDPNFFNTAESRRIYIIISIINKEISVSGKSTFLIDLNSVDDALNKYILITLAIRRINLQISSEMVEQAKSYLLSLELSPSAIIEIVNHELFEGIEWLINELYNLMSTQWNIYYQLLFCVYITELFPNEFNCIRTASLYLEANQPKYALTYLEKIGAPSSDVKDLISALKGVNCEQ